MSSKLKLNPMATIESVLTDMYNKKLHNVKTKDWNKIPVKASMVIIVPLDLTSAEIEQMVWAFDTAEEALRLLWATEYYLALSQEVTQYILQYGFYHDPQLFADAVIRR